MHDRLRSEIDAVAPSFNSVIPELEARKLPFLQACIKEGLRVTPPVTGLLEKEAPPEGDHVEGQFVPGRTHVGFAVYGALRDKDIFGEDADVFRPERWLEGDGDSDKTQMARSVDLVFGSGRNSCLGRPLALMELNKVFFEVNDTLFPNLLISCSDPSISQLLRRYDISIANPYCPIQSRNAGVWLQSKMLLRISDRASFNENRD